MIGIALCAVGVAEALGGTGVGWGGHTCSHKTEPRVPISINSSGLAGLDASGGWLAGVVPVLAVSWQSAEQRQEQIATKRKGGGI